MSKLFYKFSITCTIINIITQSAFAFNFSIYPFFQVNINQYYIVILIIAVINSIQITTFLIYLKKIKLKIAFYLVCISSIAYLVLLILLALILKEPNLAYTYKLTYITFHVTSALYTLSIIIKTDLNKSWLKAFAFTNFASSLSLLIIESLAVFAKIMLSNNLYLIILTSSFIGPFFIIKNYHVELRTIKSKSKDILDD
jgi:hypothetical protein